MSRSGVGPRSMSRFGISGLPACGVGSDQRRLREPELAGERAEALLRFHADPGRKMSAAVHRAAHLSQSAAERLSRTEHPLAQTRMLQAAAVGLVVVVEVSVAFGSRS